MEIMNFLENLILRVRVRARKIVVPVAPRGDHMLGDPHDNLPTMIKYL